ncbi:MAG: sigma-70 family RNA polymerase sigma factor [Clostridia bacterium]|nr:sigma-70 family RNA polymerase sigma factor [Clostridia bacterium]
MDDTKIIDLFWARSEDALTQMSEKYGNYCNTVAFGILRDSGHSEECVNDAYLKLWNSIPPCRPDNLKAFAAKTVRNTALDMLEKSTAQKRSGINVALEELENVISTSRTETEDAVVLGEMINGFLLSLGDDARRMFICRYWYFMTVKEIADAWSVSESKVKMSLLRTRKKLQKYIEREGMTL